MNNFQNIDLKAIAQKAMAKYGFEPQFPRAVVAETDALPESLPLYHDRNVRDLRELLWSSIDNYDSMDLDQLEYCERGEGDEITIRVAIADVDHFVPKSSYTDNHAAHNGTSVYTGVLTFPMLPDKLSKGITSLLPGLDRRAMIIEYMVLPHGELRPGDLYPALVRNKAKLVYEEIGDWLEGKTGLPKGVSRVDGLEDQLRLQKVAMGRLKTFRRAQGALELTTLEAEPVVENGRIKDIVVQRQNTARCLIEEFMIAANSTMVAFLGKAAIPMIQRVVRVPKYWDGIVLTAAIRHETLPAKPDAKALAEFLIRQKKNDPEHFPDLSLTIVKLLGPGEYVMLEPGKEPTGHFSLAITDYTHATAPNRRYVDLVNQRLLKSVLRGKPIPYSSTKLVELSLWLSDREKGSKKVERFMRKAAAALLLRDKIGDIFDALVTGASQKGTYVRLLSPPAEGRVMQGERGLLVGQKIRVRLLKTDPYNGFIDFERIGR
ncbi:MAG: RNB domain-containing ribonuclease [Methanoregula sp.]|nr:RNB domain-containing ribonuclease [Methanoregula sp.]